jgi:5-methylcytosine-specific restriction endonuclease McrA
MTMTAHPALVLNADFRPMSYFPLSLLSWQDAISAVFSQRVSVVAEYDAWACSPSTRIRLPSVVALRRYQRTPQRVAFTRLRDRFTCQYAAKRLPRRR